MEKTEKQNKYSIIVPTYNVEKYLDECIQSVIAQTYQNWELIIVDDESSDHSVQIARKYEQKDSRIHVYQKPHGGLPHTRNWGMKYITGDYLALLDADDYWGCGHLSESENIIADTLCDMCVGNNHINVTGDWKQKVTLFPVNASTNQLALEKKLNILFSMNNYMPAAAWLTIYNVNFLKKNGLKYGEKYKCSEDLDFFLHSISKAKNIKVSDHEFYFYRQDNQGAMTKNITGEMLFCRLNIYKKWFDFYQNKTIGKFDCNKIQRKISADVPSNIDNYFNLKKTDYYKKKVKKYFYQIRYIWEGKRVTEWYFWLFYIHYPYKMLTDRARLLFQYIKEYLLCHV